MYGGKAWGHPRCLAIINPGTWWPPQHLLPGPPHPSAWALDSVDTAENFL